MGLPLEYSFYATALTHLSANVDAKVAFPLSDDSVTPQSSSPVVQMLADIKPRMYWYSVAAMTTNTPVFQSGIELQAKLQAAHPTKLDMKLDLKEKNFKCETFPWRQETELLMARYASHQHLPPNSFLREQNSNDKAGTQLELSN
uniref:Vitellogenin-A2-like n=1 Tax=Phascolarctos cinereus TaxID=38626 RepID=A0A6P5KIM6_PHACI|nr:vitellogenin-A2-like [Phascolarctos cinereus]